METYRRVVSFGLSILPVLVRGDVGGGRKLPPPSTPSSGKQKTGSVLSLQKRSPPQSTL